MSNATFGYGEPEEVKPTGYPYQYLSTNEEEKDFTESESLPTNTRSKEHNGKSPKQLSQRRRCDLKDFNGINTKNQSIYESFQDQIEGNCSCQILRSASKWSLGLNTDDGKFENSIQNAYIELIQNSKNFIYIENQFFLSGTAGKAIRNEVGQALVDRIEKAHARQENFRVLVFIPLLPAFEGEVTDSKAALLRIQIYWQHRTICRGGESIYEQLKTKGICPQDYIQFYSLRTHGRMMNGEPVSEMIYIHSKILIIDDNIMLIGSANLNDRSLQGNRDSEIAIVVEDSNKILSYMDGGEVQVGQFACSLRRRLLAEHLGCQEDDVTDPLSSEFTKILNKTAERNTQIYREIFACYPDDNQKNLKDIHKMAQEKDLDKYDKLAPKIQGRIVWYPLEFLSEENLAAPLDTKEYYIPSHLFV